MEEEILFEEENVNLVIGVESVNGKTGVVVLTTSDLENDSGYQTAEDVAEAIAGKQDTLIAGENITIEDNVISATGGGGGGGSYIAGTGIDITDDTISVDTTTIQAKLTAGSNIDITGDTISATDTTYTAGSNVQISDQNVISATNTTYTAGANVNISDSNVISATDTTYTAGTNVSISSGNVISATDTTYSAGSGLDLQGTQFSVDTTTIQPKLTAGTNISISDDTISATDTTYTAGTGLNLTGTTFSADTTVLATQNDLLGKQDTLTAGSNISISAQNVISATDTTYTAGANVSISAENVISATDTTYSNFTGTDGVTAGTAGLVPAPATTDAGEFLKADGTWAAPPTVTISQTTGQSTTEVMSQKAVTDIIGNVESLLNIINNGSES